MIEILNLFYIFFVLCIASFFPLNIFLSKKLSFNLESSLSIMSINLIILLNILLFNSFFHNSLSITIYLILFLSFLNLILDFKNLKKIFSFIFLFFSFLCLVFFFKISSYPILEWDAASHWIFKVQNFYYGFTFENLKNLPGTIGYPHLGPYLWAILWEISFIDNEYTGRLFFTFIYLVSLFLVISYFKFTRIQSILMIIFLTALTYDNFLFSGYQEPLTFSLSLIFIFLIYSINSQSYKLLILLLILCGNLILWTKNEGMFFVLLLSTFLFFKKDLKLLNVILVFFSFILLIILKSILFKDLLGTVYLGWSGYKFLSIDNIFNINLIYERLPYLFGNLAASYIKYPIVFLYLLVLLLNFINKQKIRYIKESFLFFIMISLFSISIFFFSNATDWQFKTQVGLDRIIYQTSSVYIFVILECFKNIFNKYKIKY